MKFPSQNKLQYVTGALSNDTWTVPTSGGTQGALNLVKDLSILNRRGYASTQKGVPWVYRCKFDLYLQNEDGFGVATTAPAAPPGDFMTILKIDGAQNNWVNLQAAKKWHRAREAFFRRAGVTKRMRGAYAGEIRYNWDSAGDTWLTPIDGAGDAFTGGTWDTSVLADSQDSSFQLCLTGTGVDETAASGPSVLVIGDSYLKSRMTVPVDSNLEASDVPAKYSHLNDLLESGDDTRKDDTHTIAEGEQDNPPYDQLVGSETGHDITESVELGRAVAGLGNAYGSVVVDVPFGIAQVRLTHFDAADTAITSGVNFCVQVLDIYPMQG